MNIKKYIAPCLALGLLASCNQEKINTDVYGVTDEALRQGGLEYGTALMAMQQQVISIGSPSLTTGPGNDLQATDLISSGSYIGYFGNNNNWGGNIEASWNFSKNRAGYIFEQLHKTTVQPWQEIYKLAKDSKRLQDKRTLAIANIVRCLALLRTTDTFGPIVYTEIGSGNISPTPDSQEVVYKGLLKEMDEAVQVLKDATDPVLEKYDLVYNGDPQAWLRLANSLMLRMAVRIHFKDEATAREYIAKATNASNGGLIEAKAQEAKVASSARQPLRNPYLASVTEYGETRMGATIWSYLTGYNDPRIEAMFTVAKSDGVGYAARYTALAPTSDMPKTEGRARMSSIPRIAEGAAVVYWFRASETKFLLAEAALYGLYSGAGLDDLYRQGVELSFEENGVSGATSYLNSVGTPTPYEMPYSSLMYPYSDNITAGNVYPKMNMSDSQEVKLQKIITQKYLALYPNAIEAWTEYRRTGYPLIMKPKDTQAVSRVGGTPGDKMRAPERVRYSSDAYATNPNMSKVKELLGGEDIGATKLWWVRPNRPVQQ